MRDAGFEQVSGVSGARAKRGRADTEKPHNVLERRPSESIRKTTLYVKYDGILMK